MAFGTFETFLCDAMRINDRLRQNEKRVIWSDFGNEQKLSKNYVKVVGQQKCNDELAFVWFVLILKEKVSNFI